MTPAQALAAQQRRPQLPPGWAGHAADPRYGVAPGAKPPPPAAKEAPPAGLAARAGRVGAAVALWGALAVSARAAPPPVGSEAARELERFTPAEQARIASQHDQMGRWCCSLGDFDFVTIRDGERGMQAKAQHPDATRGIPDGWLDVPDSKRVDMHGQTNIPDVVAAWYYDGRVQCIITGSGF